MVMNLTDTDNNNNGTYEEGVDDLGSVVQRTNCYFRRARSRCEFPYQEYFSHLVMHQMEVVKS